MTKRRILPALRSGKSGRRLRAEVLGSVISALVFANCGGRTAGIAESEERDDGGGRGARGGAGPSSGSTGAGGFVGTGGAFTAGMGPVTGTGGASAGAPNQCPAPPPVAGPSVLDFDHGAGDGVTHGMYVYRDPDFGGTITPDELDVASGISPGGAQGSAFHFSGSGFTPPSWGAGFGVWMTCTDASSASGIRFWLSSDRAVRVSVTTVGNLPTIDGGECLGDYSTCVPHSVDLPALPSWTEVVIEWPDLAGGFPSAFTPSEVMTIGFQVVPPVQPEWGFDVWLDELEWFGVGNGVGGQPGGDGGVGGFAGEPGTAGQGGDSN